MICPKCWYDETRVLDSREIDWWETIKRRRECENCKNRFNTLEKVYITELIVIKKDWRKELYDRQKLRRSIYVCFTKRKKNLELIEEIISNLELKWLKIWNEISTNQIWEDVLNEIKKLDLVAYVRFASVYKDFEWIEDFKEIINIDK